MGTCISAARAFAQTLRDTFDLCLVKRQRLQDFPAGLAIITLFITR